MSFHVERKKLVLKIALVQRLNHVNNNHAGIERPLDLRIAVSTPIVNFREGLPYMEVHAKMFTA